jgi:hypothetical protein
VIVGLLNESALSFTRQTEEERVSRWREVHKQWPPTWQPESPQQREFYAKREKEIMSIDATDERWENWMQFVQSRYVRNFTDKVRI